VDDAIEGRNGVLAALREAKHPLIIVGQAALNHEAGEAILFKAAQLAAAAMEGKDASSWNPLNVLHTSAALAGGLDIGFVPGEGGHGVHGMLDSGDIQLLFLLGADEFDVSQTGGAFVVYIGSHGDRGARLADIVLPGAAYTEKSGTYVNTEGRVQLGERAVFPPGDAREDWTITRALSEHLGAKIPFDSLRELRQAMYKAHPHLAAIDQVKAEGLTLPAAAKERLPALPDEPLAPLFEDFHQTNPIARASSVMAELSAVTQVTQSGATGTHG
jgi:NADH-quinone oxidoreductase subunit G